MSMPAAPDRCFTRDEVLALPDDGTRHELVYGELLVSPAPTRAHQRIAGRLFIALHAYVEREALGEAFFSPADLSWGRSDVLVQPDLFVASDEPGRADDWAALRHFSLVVEVLSPSTARYDRFTKRRLYQEMRVPLYWVVDLEHRRVERWTIDATVPTFEYERLTWHPTGARAPLEIELERLFGT